MNVLLILIPNKAICTAATQ